MSETTSRGREADELAFQLWEEIGLYDGDVRAEGERVTLSLGAARRALAFLPCGALVFGSADDR
jgi:hypothetical protein